MKHFKAARIVMFETQAEAVASTYPIGIGDIALVKNDPTSIRMGIGNKYSGANPAVISASAYSLLAKLTTEANPAAAGNLNTTGTLTAALLAGKYVKSTSAAAVTATLDTIANIVAQFGSVQGTRIPITIDNLIGANTVTVAVVTGITVPTAVLTGANTLTVAAGTIADFVLIIKDSTHALLIRKM